MHRIEPASGRGPGGRGSESRLPPLWDGQQRGPHPAASSSLLPVKPITTLPQSLLRSALLCVVFALGLAVGGCGSSGDRSSRTESTATPLTQTVTIGTTVTTIVTGP
jgi:hypothetical protein